MAGRPRRVRTEEAPAPPAVGPSPSEVLAQLPSGAETSYFKVEIDRAGSYTWVGKLPGSRSKQLSDDTFAAGWGGAGRYRYTMCTFDDQPIHKDEKGNKIFPIVLTVGNPTQETIYGYPAGNQTPAAPLDPMDSMASEIQKMMKVNSMAGLLERMGNPSGGSGESEAIREMRTAMAEMQRRSDDQLRIMNENMTRTIEKQSENFQRMVELQNQKPQVNPVSEMFNSAAMPVLLQLMMKEKPDPSSAMVNTMLPLLAHREAPPDPYKPMEMFMKMNQQMGQNGGSDEIMKLIMHANHTMQDNFVGMVGQMLANPVDPDSPAAKLEFIKGLVDSLSAPVQELAGAIMARRGGVVEQEHVVPVPVEKQIQQQQKKEDLGVAEALVAAQIPILVNMLISGTRPNASAAAQDLKVKAPILFEAIKQTTSLHEMLEGFNYLLASGKVGNVNAEFVAAKLNEEENTTWLEELMIAVKG